MWKSLPINRHPHALLNRVEAVYTVSSQLGFEALLLGKPVYCFGMPFYAGWGLTFDSKQCERRKVQVSLPSWRRPPLSSIRAIWIPCWASAVRWKRY